MVLTHNLGYPRIGAKRELKFALEAYWRGASDRAQLQQTGAELRAEHWREQAVCDLQPVGDFSFYDHVLDASFLLGHVPERFKALDPHDLDTYFAVARGQHEQAHCCGHAGEMTKWFDTNYHYIVPELTRTTRFSLHSNRLLQQVQEARRQGVGTKPVLLGPVTYLWLSKCKDDSSPLDYLDQLIPLYQVLLEQLAEAGVSWVQLDEPILVTELDAAWSHALTRAYHQLATRQINILVASYFGELGDNLQVACQLPVAGLHVDAVRGQREVVRLVDWLPPHKVLSLGVIDGRNVWKADLNRLLDWIEPLMLRLQGRLWLAPSCSLLHVPVDLNQETVLPQELGNWLSFANQKLQELEILKIALNHGRDAVQQALQENADALQQRAASNQVHAAPVQAAIAEIQPQWFQRHSNYAERATQQRALLQLPPYPTTTIGSFPQTTEIRKLRRGYKNGDLPRDVYERAMQQAIADAIHHQEELGLDVLVHGEAERNDMVEYFGEQLSGFAFTVQGWVQSYGSRCVKPPIIYGDVARSKAMTVAWTRYAQSLSDKPVKGMLTGPVTLLNWSFVRDDQPRQQTCEQLALAVREEVLDLEAAGVKIIQIDEAALREGLPLRRSDWQDYLDWAVDAFRLCANSVADTTQIHTHMCYSEFNDILQDIVRMDADVITIETSRSDMELLEAFRRFNYPNDIGPGVYDIHSPVIPSQQQIVRLLSLAAKRVPPERLWVNPDCGLKTRNWEEVLPALQNMVAAARQLRRESAVA